MQFLGKSARFSYNQGLVRLCLCVRVSVKIVRTRHTIEKNKNVKNDVCRFRDLPSNGVIARIALRDLDHISEKVRASTKNTWETFVDFDICHRMV